MLSKATEQLVKEISTQFNESAQKAAQEDPEVYLFSMLALIKQELPHVWATLKMSIELAGSEKRIKEAKKKIYQEST